MFPPKFLLCSIFRRYTLGQHALAAGDDRKAEVLFLEALDAEPTTYGACAAFMAVLGQVGLPLHSKKLTPFNSCRWSIGMVSRLGFQEPSFPKVLSSPLVGELAFPPLVTAEPKANSSFCLWGI